MTMRSYIISTRVRMARNLRHHHVPPQATRKERQIVLDLIQQACRSTWGLSPAHMFYLDTLSSLERKLLEEQYLISHTLAAQGSQRGVILPPHAPQASILVNEEDHLRIQAFHTAFNLRSAWKTAQTLENCLQDKLDFAYSDHNGYVTTCPSNAGLGARVSAMLFLPGLVMSKRIIPLITHCAAAGYTVRGTYGEGSLAQGFRLQISHQQADQNNALLLIREFERLCHQIIEHEKRAREYLMISSGKKVYRYIARAEHQLETMEQMTLAEGIRLLSLYRLGVCLERVPFHVQAHSSRSSQRSTLRHLDRLFIQIQPAHIRQYTEQYTDVFHAAPLRNRDDDDEKRIRARLIQAELLGL